MSQRRACNSIQENATVAQAFVDGLSVMGLDDVWRQLGPGNGTYGILNDVRNRAEAAKRNERPGVQAAQERVREAKSMLDAAYIALARARGE